MEVDAQTRCVHWRSAVDIVVDQDGLVAGCTGLARIVMRLWLGCYCGLGRGEWDARAVLCGACGLG